MLEDTSNRRSERGDAVRIGQGRSAPPPAGAWPISVFVHLAQNKDAETWRLARERGQLVGINDPTPYGYGRAEAMGCTVAFSRSHREGVFGKIARLGLRALLGFDLVHALRQKHALIHADMVWTHTESQFLAVAAMLLLTGANTRLLGQSVWLMDRWPRLGFLYRAFYRRLIDRVDILTFHSPQNLAVARELFPHKAVYLVPYGIPSERRLEPRPRPPDPIRVVALGNDRDRDWPTLIAAVGSSPHISLLILSGTVPAGLARGHGNVQIRNARTNAELIDSFDAATLVCVPLKPNLHASGITAIEEAVLAGVPVVTTNTGGLTAYFDPDEVLFAPPGDAAALRELLLAAAQDPEGSCARARRAQARMADGSLGAEAYIRKHVELTREALSR
ncbi:MAG: glycosyltransferase [Ancalomicrobiaceae bacterium]|nr:glycosyltransferase [Ancalomicrobiaceae bacterium]